MATFIHTADLHLGRQLHGLSLLDDQRAALDSLVELVRVRRPDALLLAGDIYDRAIPPADAVALLDDFLCRVVGQLDVPVVMIAGNHDSAERLGFGSRLFGASKLLIAGRLDHGVTPLVVEDEHGPVEVFALPFLEPPRVRALTEDDEVVDQASAMAAMVERVRAVRTAPRAVLVAHAFVQGGSESESERALSVGGASTMPASVFEGFDYVALGHLHRPQSVGGGRIGKDRVQYAGSLLKYSKSEINHEKSVTLIDVDGKGQVQFERLPLSVPREFRLVDGTLETIIEQAEAQERAADKNDYIYALLRDKGPVYDAMARLRSVYPNAVHIEQPGFVPEGAMALPNAEARRRSVPELFADFFETVQGEPLSDVERATLLDVLDEARVGEVLK